MNLRKSVANCFLLGSLAALLVTVGTSTASAAIAGVRNLSDYSNADGTKPDGKREGGDDTEALKKALADGPGTVVVGAGNYRWSEVSVPPGVTITGQGSGTIVHPTGAAPIFVQRNLSDWAIRDMVLAGTATGEWQKREDKGENGIVVDRCGNYRLSDLTLQNFNGAGLKMTWNITPESGFRHSGSLQRIFARSNYIGIHFDERAEYLNASDLSCYNNVQGCVINAGNVKISNSSFVSNTDGVIIQDKQNGSHGIISDSMLNHNDRYALLVRDAANGMVITGCAIFYGSVQIENSAGINITDGIISANIKTTGEGATVNRIAGNHFIPEGYTLSFSPQTIVTDNFTKSGPWKQAE
jgi:hypothetical protein